MEWTDQCNGNVEWRMLWTDGWMDGATDGRDGATDGRTAGPMEEGTDGRTDSCRLYKGNCILG